jgi:hypothetical protein
MKVAGVDELANAGDEIHRLTAEIQGKFAFFPDYSLGGKIAKEGQDSVSKVNFGTTIAGMAGGALVFIVAGILGILLRKRKGSINADGNFRNKS